MTLMQAHPEPAVRRRSPSAVVWINGRRAMVARMSATGVVSTCEFERGVLPEAEYLAQVVALLGGRDRVVILGPTSIRLSLERAYASRFNRPDRLIDVEPAGGLPIDALIDRVRELAG